MRVWRISLRAYCAFDGEGGRIAGARWHRRGVPVIYTAGSLALAALEFFVHLAPDLNLTSLVAVSADIPDHLQRETLDISKLPPRWRDERHLERLRNFGMEWLSSGRTAVLIVPSAVIPAEHNYLLNPVQPDFGRIQINPPEPFQFDYRMWKFR